MACSDTLCQYQSLTNRLRNCPPHSLKIPSQLPHNSLRTPSTIPSTIPSEFHQKSPRGLFRNPIKIHSTFTSITFPSKSQRVPLKNPVHFPHNPNNIPSKFHQHPINIQTNTSAFLQMSFIIAAQFPHKSSGKIPAQFPEIPKHSIKIPSRLKTFWRVYLKVPQRAELVDCVGPKLLNKVISECPKSLNSFLVCPRHFLTNLPQRVSQLSACSQSMPATFRESHLKISQLTSCHMHI